MEGNYNAIRRNLENDLAAIRQHMDSGKHRSANDSRHLHAMIKDITGAINDIDRTESRRPYSDTNIGYRTHNTRQDRSNNDTRNTINDLMDFADRILPHIANDSNDRYNAYNDMDNDLYDDMDDDEMYEVVDRRGRLRGRPRRTRRGVGRWTQVRTHVRRMPRRRADLDDSRYDDDARYDANDNDYRSEDDVARDNNDRRMYDAVSRAAADAAAYTARNITTDERRSNNIYPTTPVMPRSDYRSDNRYDTRQDTRFDDATSDATHTVGPTTRR